MIVYFSAMSKKHFELIKKLDIRINVLKSYFEVMRSHKFEKPSCAKRYFLDSGAYSAHNRKKDIDIIRYIEYIKKNVKEITVYAGLDSIGDEKRTYENQLKMEEEGLAPLPTWHMGEKLRYLDYYCERYDYVALGGMVGSSHLKLKRFCYDAFNRYPNQHFHGFGITDLRVLKSFPWYSVDSTTYLNGSKFGHIIHEGTQIHVNKLKHLELWDELMNYVDHLDSNLDTFKTNAHMKDVFNIIQFQKHGQLAEKGGQRVADQVRMFQ
jgi:hypothetical protein